MYSYTISGAFASAGSDVTSGVLSGAGNKSVTVTATDTRSRTNSTTQTVTYLAYSIPSLTTFNAVRGTYAGGSWTSDETGDHIRVEASGTVSLSANGNTGTITVKIGATNPDATSGNYYYFTSTNGTTSYTITGTITDSVGNTTTRGLTVSTIAVPFNINVDLPGIGVGMIAQTAKRLEVAQDWSLVANGKSNQIPYMPYSWECLAQDSSSGGYIRVCTLTIGANNVRTPIVFEIQRRSEDVSHKLTLSFAQESNTDPAVGSFVYEGSSINAFVYKTATSTWDLYVAKNTAYERLTARMYLNGWAQRSGGITATHADAYLSSTPSGAVMAIALHTSARITGTVNTGYIAYTNSNITVNSKISVTEYYRSGGTIGYLLIVQPTNGYMNVYVRNPDRSLPANGTVIELNVVIENG